MCGLPSILVRREEEEENKTKVALRTDSEHLSFFKEYCFKPVFLSSLAVSKIIGNSIFCTVFLDDAASSAVSSAVSNAVSNALSSAVRSAVRSVVRSAVRSIRYSSSRHLGTNDTGITG